MQIIGLLEADFQGGRAYASGGVGPFFQQERIEEPFTVWEVLAHCGAALRKLGVVDAMSLFLDEDQVALPDEDEYADADEDVDEDEAYEDDDEDEAYEDEPLDLDGVIDAARREWGDAEPASFHLMLTYDDDTFSHVLSVEAHVDHPSDEASISVLDRATPAEEPEDLDTTDLEDALEKFLRRVQGELDKELALEEAEIDLWFEVGVGEEFGPGVSSIGLPE